MSDSLPSSKAHRRKVYKRVVAPSTPPERPDNSVPPSIKKVRKMLKEARKALKF